MILGSGDGLHALAPDQRDRRRARPVVVGNSGLLWRARVVLRERGRGVLSIARWLPFCDGDARCHTFHFALSVEARVRVRRPRRRCHLAASQSAGSAWHLPGIRAPAHACRDDWHRSTQAPLAP
eukprot:6193783-Pleurochrysis_carterae.AAC.2